MKLYCKLLEQILAFPSLSFLKPVCGYIVAVRSPHSSRSSGFRAHLVARGLPVPSAAPGQGALAPRGSGCAPCRRTFRLRGPPPRCEWGRQWESQTRGPRGGERGDPCSGTETADRAKAPLATGVTASAPSLSSPARLPPEVGALPQPEPTGLRQGALLECAMEKCLFLHFRITSVVFVERQRAGALLWGAVCGGPAVRCGLGWAGLAGRSRCASVPPLRVRFVLDAAFLLRCKGGGGGLAS